MSSSKSMESDITFECMQREVLETENYLLVRDSMDHSTGKGKLAIRLPDFTVCVANK